MKIAIYSRNLSDDDRQTLTSLEEHMQRQGIATCHLHDGDNTRGCDLLLSVGGDGTLLSCVQLLHGNEGESLPPIVGVNFGHLGFLTTAGRDGLDGLVDDLMAGHYSIEERTLIEVEGNGLALNEVFLHRSEGSSQLRTRVSVDGHYVATYAGDGVIVATPTGSTAYSLSCGGPILTPDSRCFAITPIAAHTLTLRPIIVPDSAEVRLEVDADDAGTSGRAASSYNLGIDSRRFSCSGNATFVLRRATTAVRLVRTAGQDFFSAIRSKLMWGTEVRQ